MHDYGIKTHEKTRSNISQSLPKTIIMHKASCSTKGMLLPKMFSASLIVIIHEDRLNSYL